MYIRRDEALPRLYLLIKINLEKKLKVKYTKSTLIKAKLA